MSNKIITKLNEYIDNHSDMSLIVEMAKINGKNELNFDVYVYGGDRYGNRNEHGQPHFHIADNMKRPNKFKLSVLIPTINEWKTNPDLVILEHESTLSDWSGLRKEKRALMEWLSKPHHGLGIISNLRDIIHEWNTLNSENDNVRQVKIDEGDLF